LYVLLLAMALTSASAWMSPMMGPSAPALRAGKFRAGCQRQKVGAGMISIMMAGKDAGSTHPDLNTGAYHDSNEVDKTTMEGQVTNVGDRISWTTENSAVRGELIQDATAESDVTEEVWQAEYIAAFGVPPPMEKLFDDETQAMMGWYDGEIDRDAELAKAKEQGWVDQGATVSAESDATIALARAKENAKKPASGDENEDNSIQARFMRDRQRIRQAGLEHSNAEIVEQDMQLGVDRKSKVDYGAGGYVPKRP
jgi:hypothetical protein